jgi:shikimate kinase
MDSPMDAPIPHLVLIGPRAAGKTTLGRLTAQRLGRPFVDLDDRVREAFGGATIKAIFESHGESAFREAELNALRAAIDEPAGVIALGGGAPMTSAGRALVSDARLAGKAYVVYLLAEVETLQARLRESDLRDRPSLTGGDPIEEVANVLEQRNPTYHSLADRSLDTQSASMESLAQTLAAFVSH